MIQPWKVTSILRTTILWISVILCSWSVWMCVWQVCDLAHALRDGVLLCQLLNNLLPQSVNLRLINLRPQMSQVQKESICVIWKSPDYHHQLLILMANECMWVWVWVCKSKDPSWTWQHCGHWSVFNGNLSRHTHIHTDLRKFVVCVCWWVYSTCFMYSLTWHFLILRLTSSYTHTCTHPQHKAVTQEVV